MRARVTDGERKSGRTRSNVRIKESGFASVTPPSSFPHLTCLLARCPFFSIDQRSWPAPGCQVRVHSGVMGGVLCSSLSSGGQMKSQLDLTTGMRGHIFSTDLHLTPAQAITDH